MDERLWGILTDSFPKLLKYGIEVTVPLTIVSFALALIIAVTVALIQYAHVRGLQQICRFYIWITRGTPLLVQLYIVFYGLPSVGIKLEAFTAAVLRLYREPGNRAAVAEAAAWAFLLGAVNDGEISLGSLKATTGDLLSIPGLDTNGLALEGQINQRVSELLQEYIVR